MATTFQTQNTFQRCDQQYKNLTVTQNLVAPKITSSTITSKNITADNLTVNDAGSLNVNDINAGNVNADNVNIAQELCVDDHCLSFDSNHQFKFNKGANESIFRGANVNQYNPPGSIVKLTAFNDLRYYLPNDPQSLGSSTTRNELPFSDMPTQAGNENATGSKYEYDVQSNKISLAGLDVKNTFQVIPTAAECTTAQNAEITGAGFDVAPFFWPRTASQQWYGVTSDANNFYYSAWGQGLFPSLFGFGTSSIFVCRSKTDGSLVWVKNVFNYTVTAKELNYLGNDTVISRMTLAIHKDRLYTTSMLSNIGPQLFCINKNTGARIWSVAYYTPLGVPGVAPTGQSERGGTIVSPTTPFGTFDGTPFAGSTQAMGDLHINVKEITPGAIGVFVGVSSFQNAVNAGAFGGFPVYNDQGYLIRIDDLGSLPTIVWSAPTSAPLLKAGDTITAGGAAALDPFIPTTTTLLAWRDTTAGGADEGKFGSPALTNGVTAPILDNTGPNPGYRPTGYGPGGPNNLTIPVMINIFIPPAPAAITEASVGATSIFFVAAPGIGAGARIHQVDAAFPGPAPMGPGVGSMIEYWTSIQPAAGSAPIKKLIFAYLSAAEILASDAGGAPYLAGNIGTRYIATFPTPFTVNAQEAAAMNYYGNSVWGQQPTIDLKNNLIFHGSGQAHSSPINEIFQYADPAFDYIDRKQTLIDAEYGYTQNNPCGAPPTLATLTDIQAAKDAYASSTTDLSLSLSLPSAFPVKSPRGNMSYSDGIFGLDINTGVLQFAYRSIPYDTQTFISEEPNTGVIQERGIDGDVSSGIHLFPQLEVEGGSYKNFIATQPKMSITSVLDISGLNPNVVFDHTNLTDKGVVPASIYNGPDGFIGGSNFGNCKAGKYMYSVNANGSPVGIVDAGLPGFGSRSNTIQDNYNNGYEFHVAQDGRVFQIQDSFVQAIDISKQKIVWECELGQRAGGAVTYYNGIVYACQGQGVLYGLDPSNGKIISKFDGKQHGMAGGISVPSFSGGEGIWINNYTLIGTIGGLGQNGVILEVDKDLLVSDDDTISTITQSRTYASFDTNPKARAPPEVGPPCPGVKTGVLEALVLNDTVTHVWTGTSVAVTHTISAFSGTFAASSYVPSSKRILFDDPTAQGDFRYIAIQLINKNVYILEYQFFDGSSWIDRTATLDV